MADLKAVLQLPEMSEQIEAVDKKISMFLDEQISNDPYYLYILFGWIFVHRLEASTKKTSSVMEIYDSNIFGLVFKKLFMSLGMSKFHAQQQELYIRCLCALDSWWECFEEESEMEYNSFLTNIFNDKTFEGTLQINSFRKDIYFNKEAFETLAGALFVLGITDIYRKKLSKKESEKSLIKRFRIVSTILDASKKSSYKVSNFIELFMPETKRKEKSSISS